MYEFFSSFLCRLNVKLYGSKTTLKKNKILITAQNLQWRTIRDFSTKEFKKGDAFFNSVISQLRENDENEIVTIYPLGYSISNLKVIIDKRKRQKDIIHKPFDIYWSLDIWKKGRKAKKYFSSLWKDLKNDENFKNLLEYEDIKFDLLENELSYYFMTVFGMMVEYIEMAKRMIDEEKPDLILLLNEYGRFERALVIAGKLKGVPVLAVQHGAIYPTHKAYMYAQDEISRDGSVTSPYCPIPDITAVYGTYHKDILTKVSAYPDDSVVVTGQPRYDVLYCANKIYDNEKFFKRYKINPDHKIVLWATACHGYSNEENIKNFKTVFETMQNIKDATLIIKPHPGEGERYTKMIKEYLKEYKIDAVLTPKNSDTYEQLFICDLMITKDSTTAMEAISLNKPVIVLNLSGEPDVVDYVAQAVALGVYRGEDLKPAIENLLKGDTDLAKNRERYIEKYLYKIDGKATERVVKLVEEIIRKRDKQNVNL
ncbi:MAG: CDP-glycerol glycerophosphotransferase family protein [Methanophagales archaeon]|nr:CDP-glycerol glycerophosphotransferase family protein [Methanophagales archaeon]